MPLDQELNDDEKEMSFLDHLEELRWHVVRSMIAIVFFTIFAFIAAPWIFDHIIFAPARVDFPTFRVLCKLGKAMGVDAFCVQEIPFKIQSRFMTGQFTMHILAAFIIGFIISFPYVAWEIWRFVRPGLYSKERKSSRGAVSAISILFLLGILFGYYVLAPLMISFLANYRISDMISNEFDITSYVSTVVSVVLGCGLLFQLPVVMFFLTKIGIVTPTFLRTYRKHAVIVILIVGAIVTPTSDPFTLSLISFPLYILYEISILISSRVVKAKAREEAEERLKEQSST
jgi:sec-independent protein translocase protein TatC